MKYSFIVKDFYGIQLNREELALVDAHFFSAAHHYYYAESDDLAISRFHQEHFWKHITQLMKIIQNGDFAKAFDNTQRGLDMPSGWSPALRIDVSGKPSDRNHLFPDPEMFRDMQADPKFPPGDEIPYDQLLDPSYPPHQIPQYEAGFA